MKYKTLEVYIDNELAGKINKARGIAKTSTFIREVLEIYFECNPVTEACK